MRHEIVLGGAVEKVAARDEIPRVAALSAGPGECRRRARAQQHECNLSRRIGERERNAFESGDGEIVHAATHCAGVIDQRINTAGRQHGVEFVDDDGVGAEQIQIACDNKQVVGLRRAGGIIGQIEIIQRASGESQCVGDGQGARRICSRSRRNSRAFVDGNRRADNPGSAEPAIEPHAAAQGHGAVRQRTVHDECAFSDEGFAGVGVRAVES